MADEDIVELKVGFATMQQKLKDHCDSSVVFRKELKDIFLAVEKDIKGMKEDVSERKVKCFETSKNYTNLVVTMSISIPTTVYIIYRLFESFHN